MSWSLTIPSVPKADFAAAVDAAVPSGQDGVPGRDEAVATGRERLKALADLVPEPFVGGTAGGHVNETPDGWGSSFSVAVTGYTKLPG